METIKKEKYEVADFTKEEEEIEINDLYHELIDCVITCTISTTDEPVNGKVEFVDVDSSISSTKRINEVTEISLYRCMVKHLFKALSRSGKQSFVERLKKDIEKFEKELSDN